MFKILILAAGLAATAIAPAKADYVQRHDGSEALVKGAIIVRDYETVCSGTVANNVHWDGWAIRQGRPQAQIDFWSDQMATARARIGTDEWCARTENLMRENGALR